MSQSAWIAILMGAVAIVGGLAAGCTTTSVGQPLPTIDGHSTERTASSPKSSPSTSAQARPREIRLDGKDPCALVSELDWPKFHIEKPGRRRQEEPAFKSPNCLYSNDVGVGITLVVTEGMGKWTDGSRSGIAETVPPIEGFPAISITGRGNKYDCDVAVDVADGQYLLATVILTPGTVSQVPERCEYAHQLAESAMRTLVAGA